jgi:hypothetical protein
MIPVATFPSISWPMRNVVLSSFYFYRIAPSRRGTRWSGSRRFEKVTLNEIFIPVEDFWIAEL